MVRRRRGSLQLRAPRAEAEWKLAVAFAPSLGYVEPDQSAIVVTRQLFVSMVLLPDRIKRQAILNSTRFLPLAARVRLREALLGRSELRRGRRARYFGIGHPKSGNTWLRTMISRLYQQRYALPESHVLKSDELHLANPACPRFLVTNALYSYEGVIGEAMRADRADAEFR